MAPRVQQLCAKCHVLPLSASFPRRALRHEVEQVFNFYEESALTVSDLPDVDAVVRYFESQAPDDLIVSAPESNGSKPSIFRQRAALTSDSESPAIAYLSPAFFEEDGVPQLLSCDMRTGAIQRHRFSEPTSINASIATLAHPAHIERVDLDADGNTEWVVAELGSFRSGDHHAGAVVWLQPNGEAGHWQPTLLASGMGRVADVQPGDFDQDGDQDLLVGEFGHVRTGNVWLLENVASTDGVPLWERHCLDERAGCIHVPAADLNGDGRLDFVALFSQEHEAVVAYLNQGNMQFEPQELFRAADPAFGSSGIQLIDLDGDGDQDVLYSNGDTFGSAYLKPYHAIHWLENRGTFPFVPHQIAPMVGVQRALAADLDGDQDQDIVAVAFMPENLVGLPELSNHDSVLWLEQVRPGEFVRRSIERTRDMSKPSAPALRIAASSTASGTFASSGR